jgi:hypothetical protein
MEINEKYKWLYDDMLGLKEKINFRNRIEYRVNGKLHNSVGPALIQKYDPLHKNNPSSDDFEHFYINGEKVEMDEWIIYNRKYKLKKLKKNIKYKKEDE